jgi:hypothetical protein
MTVINPGMLGLIVRRNERTRAYVDGCIDRFARANPHMSVYDYARHLNVDEDLFATSVAMNGYDLEGAMEALEAQGCIRGQDFVPTDSVNGVIGDFPDWLVMELAPSGNSPELEAKMEPEVREMWERNRTKTYRLKPGA